MVSSGIPTLDAANMTYEFENVRVHQSDIEDNAKNKLFREVNKLKSLPPNLEYLDDFRDGLTGTSGTAFLDKDSGEVIIAYTGTNPNADFVTDVMVDVTSILMPYRYHYDEAFKFYERI